MDSLSCMGKEPSDWRPTASLAALRYRAGLLEQTRRFLTERGYWEVETPILSADTCVDTHLDPLVLVTGDRPYFLQTSPEFGMKRLLAAGAGSIFQISRVFRAGEAGQRHNPEFTMVEWYRVAGHYHGLMDEVGDLVSTLLHAPSAQRCTYRTAFQSAVGIDPLTAPDEVVRQHAAHAGLADAALSGRDELLNFLLAVSVEPELGRVAPTFLYDFPATQSALATVVGDPPVAQRFELYWRGVELCNGYQELTDANELRRRQRRENARRVQMGKPALPENSRLLAAMDAGLPPSTGVALGFDRLVMLGLGTESIGDVFAFPFATA